MEKDRHSVLALQTDPAINDASHQWEEDYRRRARLMTRDYVNPNSTRLTHQRRSRSADSRPQYRTPSRTQRTHDEAPDFNSAASESSIRAQCLDIFYPTNDETRARVMYDTRGLEFSSHLPKPIGLYQMDTPTQFGQSLSSTPSFRESSSSWRNGNHTSVTPSGMVDPYGVPSPNVRRSSHHSQSLGSVPGTRTRHDYEYVKNSLMMFGEEEASSLSTGLSQQELLDRRRREYTTARRKEKKQRKRIVNLPSTLFPPHSSRQRQQPNSSPDSDMQDYFHHDYEPPSLSLSHQISPAPNQFSARGDAPDRKGNPRMASPYMSAERAPETLPFSKSLSSMVNRLKNEPSSSGRRWKIIPSLSRSRSRSRSPVQKIRSGGGIETGAFPSPPRVISSVRYGDPNRTESTNHFLDKSNDPAIGHDGSDVFEYMSTPPKRALDPPSRASISDDYADDIQEWNYDKKQPINDEGGNGQHENFSDYGGNQQWDDHRQAGARPLAGPYNSHGTALSLDEYKQSKKDASHSTPQSRQHYESKGGLSTPHKYGNIEAFPDPSAPFTPMTASMTIDSNESSHEFDPFTTPMAASEDIIPDHAYSKRSQDFASFEDRLWKNHTQEPRSTDPLIAAMSRLNNPPGLDMDFYSRPRPDAPATASLTPNSNPRQLKLLPTSATDFNINVRWSENLDQLPTPRRSITERPKSILRSTRLRLGSKGTGNSLAETTTMSKSVRISGKPAPRGQFISEHPSAIGFVDNNGRALSPITSFDAEYGDHDWPPNVTTPVFERNIPEEFQRAFLTQNMVSRTDGDSGQMTSAYSDFIESVASVVVQTAARQFLAKLRVHKMRQMRYASRDVSRKLWLQKAAAAKKNQNSSTRRNTGVKLDMFSLAAVRIQAVYRGWYARDCIAIDNYCATIIQKNFRRKMASESFAVLVSRHKASLKTIYNIAATVIQSQWRCFKGEMDFLRAYEDILLVQSIARGWVSRHRIRSWMRKHGIQTSKSLNESVNSSYSLPHGYHNHTAFMKQSLPSPVRSTHTTKSQQRRTDNMSKKESHSPGHSSRPQNISIDASADGPIEIYHRTQDGENTNKEEKSTTNMTRKKSATKWQGRELASFNEQGGLNERNTSLTHALDQMTKASPQEGTVRDREAATQHPIQHGGHAFVPTKNIRPLFVSPGTVDRVMEKSASKVQSQNGLFGNRSEGLLHSRPAGGILVPAEAQIDSTHLPTASSAIVGWRSRVKSSSFDQGGSSASSDRPTTKWSSPLRGNETKPQRPVAGQSGSLELADNKGTHAPAPQFATDRVGCISESKPDNNVGYYESKEHATASSILAGWLEREKGGSFGQGTTSTNCSPTKNTASLYSEKRHVVASPHSFDLTAKKPATTTIRNSVVPDPKIGNNGADSEALGPKPFPSDVDSNSEPRQHAEVSNILVAWRKREKKGGSFDQGSTSTDSSRTANIASPYRQKRHTVSSAVSFDLIAKNASPTAKGNFVVHDPKIDDIGADSEAMISEAMSDHLPSNHEPTEHVEASDVLAGWGKVGGIGHGSATNCSSRGSVKKPSWLKNNEERGNGTTGGASPKTTSDQKPSWQKNRSGLSLSQSHEESRYRPREEDNTATLSLERSMSYQMKYRSDSHDIQDEKKEDVAVSSATTRSVDQSRIQVLQSTTVAIQHDHSAGLAESAPEKVDETALNGSSWKHSLTSDSPPKSSSKIQVENRIKRSSSEQQRIDDMHLMFIRAGIMGRERKETISFAHTTSAEYEGMKMQDGGDFEPLA